MSSMVANLEFGLVCTFFLFLGCSCTTLLSSCFIRSSCCVITKSFWLILFTTLLRRVLVVTASSELNPVICLACSRTLRLFSGVFYLISDPSRFYLGTTAFCEVPRVRSTDLLLFSSSNRLMRGFDIRTGHNPNTTYPCLQFKAVKASTRASL
jgi:hypothetical protein